MDQVIVWFLTFSGLMTTLMGLIVYTENIKSSMYFKVLPVFLGAGHIFGALYLAGYVVKV